jgi:hypothetical protein
MYALAGYTTGNTSEEAETSYKNLVAFFEKYTNSVEDNLN